ncbi:hypothetical protein L1987_15321 [Smallanthus sonchifolius]|uniref:Uncharacterized protein n=1 Tax=Smallanthus sonchifolius TaxID=185202 RepID=A0ACB9J629_9ASTR|nr:hypothetical protein L1987_15321 [Smallanthus sonchifolius]
MPPSGSPIYGVLKGHLIGNDGSPFKIRSKAIKSEIYLFRCIWCQSSKGSVAAFASGSMQGRIQAVFNATKFMSVFARQACWCILDDETNEEYDEMKLACALSMDSVETMEGCEGACFGRVGLRLPDGRRVQRNFLRSDPIQKELKCRVALATGMMWRHLSHTDFSNQVDV